MKYFLDTEFIEKPGSIQLVSIGIVSEIGLEMYLESSEFNPDDADDWVKRNVLAKLRFPPEQRRTRAEIREQVLAYIGTDARPQFWGYYADYDWVVFCWLFGRMIDLPKHFPKYCLDMKQVLEANNNPRVPFEPAVEHDALSDAHYIRGMYKWAATGYAPVRVPPLGCVLREWIVNKEKTHE